MNKLQWTQIYWCLSTSYIFFVAPKPGNPNSTWSWSLRN